MKCIRPSLCYDFPLDQFSERKNYSEDVANDKIQLQRENTTEDFSSIISEKSARSNSEAKVNNGKFISSET